MPHAAAATASAWLGELCGTPGAGAATGAGVAGGVGDDVATAGMLRIGGRFPVPSTSSARSAVPRSRGSAKGSNACASSPTLEKRSPGSFSRHFITASQSSFGRSARSVLGFGAFSCATLKQSSRMVSASKGTRPVRSSNAMAPSAQRSERSSTCFDDRICSGDM